MAIRGADSRTLATDPTSGHRFAWSPESQTVWEFDASGAPVAVRDLAGATLTDVAGMTVAPSADGTDPANEQALYIADAGDADGQGAGIVEVALVAPAVDSQAIEAAASSVQLLQTMVVGAGSAWNPDSPDPSGLAYIPAGAPGVPTARQDRLVSADGEVDEATGAGFHGVNVWFAPRNGSVQTSTMDTSGAGTSPTNKEPVGAAYDAARQELYICKDGASGQVWVYDMKTGAQVRAFSVSGAPFQNADPEGVGFDSVRNILYMVDAIDNDLVKVLPGPSGVIGMGGEQVFNYDLQQFGQSEPEGLDVDVSTGNVWIVSNKVSGGGTPEPMIEVSPNGALVSSVSIAAANPNSPGGVALAPASNGSGAVSIYVADRGVDNNEVPNENDGKIYEFSTGGSTGAAPVANFSWAQSASGLTVVFSDSSTNNPTAWLWDFDPASGDDGSSAPQPSYTYPEPGTYTVTLTVTNSFGSDSVSKPVTVTAEPPPPTGNLLANGGFELDADNNGQPDGWSANSSFTRSTAITAREGAFVGRHSTPGESTYNVDSDATVVGGEQYILSGFVNAPTNADKFKFLVKIKWRGPSGNITTVTVTKFTDDTAGTWASFTGTVTAPSAATSARVIMTVNGLNGTVYVDDFMLHQAP
jgi:PKD repeat protein